MAFHPFELTVPHVAFTVLGGFIVFFGMFSLFLRERLYVGEACWAFLFGVVIGPYALNWFNPRQWGDEAAVNTVTLEFTRIVLAVGVFAIGAELPKAYMKKHWKSIAMLLGPLMTYGWFVSSALIYALIPNLSFLSSLAVGACLTPTDPILAAAVIGGKYADKHVPAHIRHLLAAESGCNDGAAFPFLYIALYLIINKGDTGQAVEDWFLLLWLYQVVLGTFIGGVIGFGFRHLMKFCERKDLIDRQSYVAQYISLAVFTAGVGTLLGSDDLLASFVCGTAFAWDGFFNKQTEETVFSSVIDLLFNIASFVYVGAWMPFSEFDDPVLSLTVWRLVVLAITILVLRRLPIMLVLYRWIPDVKTFQEAVFAGHFGPIGIGAVFISTLAAEKLPHPHDPPQNQAEMLAASIQPIVAFMVLASILIHGLSIPSFSLGRRVHSVSRTWSRHQSGGIPDWANQTQMANRPEDIVVNRDAADVEAGNLTPDEKLMVQEHRARNSHISAGTLTDEKLVDSPEGSQQGSSRELNMREGGEVDEHGRQASPDNAPDGDALVSEWREGHHKVIERRVGSNGEVEVEVVRNFYNDEDENDSNLWRGTEEVVHNHVLSHIHHHTHPDKPPREQSEHDSRDLRTKIQEVLSPVTSRPEEDGEEEWASDAETGGATGSSVPLQTRRSRSPKQKPAGRRRTSMRKNVLGAGQPRPDEQSRPGSSSSSMRDVRLDGVRGMESKRASSPSRSIRFKDDAPGSGATTPQRQDADDSESIRSPTIKFDLPTPPKPE